MKHALHCSMAAAILAMAAGGAEPAGAQESIIIPHEKIIRVPAASAVPANAAKLRQRQPAAPSAQKKFKGGSEPKPGRVVIHDFNFTHTLDKATPPTRPRLLDSAGNSAARRRK
jgi:hypothetical protein